MTDRNSTTVDIENAIRDAELVAAKEHLHGKGFIKLPEVDVIHRETVALEQLGHSEDGADAHLVGLATRNRGTSIDAERFQTALRRNAGFHDDRRRCTVGKLACVACRDEAVLSYWIQAGEALE